MRDLLLCVLERPYCRTHSCRALWARSGDYRLADELLKDGAYAVVVGRAAGEDDGLYHLDARGLALREYAPGYGVPRARGDVLHRCLLREVRDNLALSKDSAHTADFNGVLRFEY